MTLLLHPLLKLCAHLPHAAPAPAQICDTAAAVTAWDDLIPLAERHGIGPLLYVHLRDAEASLPRSTKRELQGLYLRHQHANQVRAAMLKNILTAFEHNGIEALVLKGGALAHLVYPQPALRPMSDLDILVQSVHARQAQQILTTLGFQAPLPDPNEPLPGKHLLAATQQVEGLLLSVEIHHNLFNIGSPVSLTLTDLSTPPRRFDLNGQPAATLPLEELLWHLCEHLTLVGQPLRLIWVADIVGLAESFADEIDWERVKRRYPGVPSTLSLFHYITPLSEKLQRTAGLNLVDSAPPPGVGQPFTGWPQTSIQAQKIGGKSWRAILSDTLLPSEWWLRLYYRQGAAGSIWGVRWVRHPGQVLAWAGQLAGQLLVQRILRE